MDFLTTPSGTAPTALFRTKFDDFARQYKEEVILQEIPWDAYWRELVNVSVHKMGADVAEIGSTWVEPLVAMDVLAPFSREDADSIGGEQSFFSSVWQSVGHEGGQAAWGIPARIEMRMIFYWKDMFEAAGIEPQQAFSSPEAMSIPGVSLPKSFPITWSTVLPAGYGRREETSSQRMGRSC
jgi:ABC-type glycerol-3-phosphate transport system substrate-binding protein